MGKLGGIALSFFLSFFRSFFFPAGQSKEGRAKPVKMTRWEGEGSQSTDNEAHCAMGTRVEYLPSSKGGPTF